MWLRRTGLEAAGWMAACLLSSCTSATVGTPSDGTVGTGGAAASGLGGTAEGVGDTSAGGVGGWGLTLNLGQGGAVVTGDAGNTGDGPSQSGGDCADSAKVVYLVTEQNYLYSFDPRISGLSAYQRIGTLACETASTPQSMSVDRLGKAYVFYSSGHLYYVSTTTAECTPTSYEHPVSPSKSFNQLGMGFTAQTPDSSSEVLYIQSPDFGLATVDLQTLAVDKLNVFQSISAELTGGPDAVLFKFQSDTAELTQIDRNTFQTQLIHKFNLSGVTAFAFSRYAGSFYVFTAGSGRTTVTTAFDPQTNVESVRDPDIGVTVVGAGQSTCVPPPFIP